MFTVIFTMIGLTNLWLAAKVLLAIRNFRAPEIKKSAGGQFPSVSVLIAARNEQSAMRDCLDRVLASNYPKLEVIVLDDNSVDNTSQEVRNFARAGVRFVRGEEPPKGWLGRNYAYHRLSKEALGDILLFLSVDTKVSRSAIGNIVDILNDQQASMASFLPSRADNYRASVIFSSLRYFNELIFAKDENPPSSSSAWAIRADCLSAIGGFERFRRAILPEKSIAKALVQTDDFWQSDEFDQIDPDNQAGDHELSDVQAPACSRKYFFAIDESKIGINFEKRWLSQIQTARRNFALKIHKNRTFLFMIIPMILHFLPFVWSAWLFFGGELGLDFWLLLVQILISGSIYAVYVSLAWTRGWWLGVAVYPLVLLQEIVIFVSAIWLAFFGRIIWRGREIDFRKF